MRKRRKGARPARGTGAQRSRAAAKARAISAFGPISQHQKGTHLGDEGLKALEELVIRGFLRRARAGRRRQHAVPNRVRWLSRHRTRAQRTCRPITYTSQSIGTTSAKAAAAVVPSKGSIDSAREKHQAGRRSATVAERGRDALMVSSWLWCNDVAGPRGAGRPVGAGGVPRTHVECQAPHPDVQVRHAGAALHRGGLCAAAIDVDSAAPGSASPTRGGG